MIASARQFAFSLEAKSARQSNSALRSSPVNHFSTGLGGHPFEKSMISGPSNSARLKSTFHFSSPFFNGFVRS
jgi:hypothetical protein